MESVLKKIREARKSEIQKKQNANMTFETNVDGCAVRLRFAQDADKKALSVAQDMLMSAYLDSAIASVAGRESA
jgi:hypothetical protein